MILTVALAASLVTADAARVFARARELCAADAGTLWGVSLCVPMMVADPNTREAAANVTISEATRDGSVFRLTLPSSALISTGPTEYGGVRLVEIMWPLTSPPGFSSAEFRDVLLMHESFHVVQPQLGFTGYRGEGSISGGPHLDTRTGRIWLRGELHALHAALQATDQSRRLALADALAMRFYRQSLFAGAAEQEREQDVIEGLAEATGIDAGLPPNRRVPYALEDMAFIEAQPSYARSFAYATGPGYSELLDARKPGWRRAVTAPSDVARLAMRAYDLSVPAPDATQAQTIIARYGGVAIESEEAARAARVAALETKYTNEFVKGSTITLPMKRFSIRFNPRDIETFAQYGTVYHTLTLKAAWGTLDVSGGEAMISKDFTYVRVASPRGLEGTRLRGQGWTVTLAAGYRIVPDPRRAGSYTVSQTR